MVLTGVLFNNQIKYNRFSEIKIFSHSFDVMFCTFIAYFKANYKLNDSTQSYTENKALISKCIFGSFRWYYLQRIFHMRLFTLKCDYYLFTFQSV